MRSINKHPMVLIRAVTVLSFGLALLVQSIVCCPVADNTVEATDAEVRDFDGKYTPLAGASLATMDFLSYAQKTAALEAARVEVVAAPEEPEPEEVQEVEEEPSLDENSDVILIARLIESEGGGLTTEEQAAIGLTVLYRCDSSKWPNTVAGNIYKPNQYATPKSSCSEKALNSAQLAYTLWSEGRGDEILPSSYMSFFGVDGHNWFYDKNLTIYNFPGVTAPSDIYEKMTQIIPALRRSAEQNSEETTEKSELINQSFEEENVANPSTSSDDFAQYETDIPSYEIEEEINGVSQGFVSDEQPTLSVDTVAETSEITSDSGDVVTVEQEN